MELACTHSEGTYLVFDAGTVVDGVRIEHVVKVCDRCGRVVVNAKYAGTHLAFEFLIDSPEAVEAVVRSCRQSAQGAK